MKFFLQLAFLLAALCAAGQGTTLRCDQQSSSDETLPATGASSLWDFASGQSFTPALPFVDFVKFMFQDANPNDGLGVSVYVTLRSDAINGTIIGTTAPVSVPNAFAGPATFLFPTQVQVTPGAAYYFNVVPQSGGPFSIFGGASYNYPAGTAFVGTHPDPTAYLWFHEGLVVPEPSSTALLLLGGAAFACLRCKTAHKNPPPAAAVSTMKTEFLAALVCLAALCAAGQGTLTYRYDQQSSTNEGFYGNNAGQRFSVLLPTTGQAFTPTLSAIDFIKLEINDSSATSTVGSTWFVNLHSTSITGPILASASADLPGGFTGAASFLFPNTTPLTPGTQYWFDINTPNAANWNILFSDYNYQGGDAWVRGSDFTAGGYWFREGIIVPEPSSAALLLLGGAAFACLRRKNRT
jgi:hypothetical protein